MDIIPTADFIRDRNIDFQAKLRLKTIEKACGADRVSSLDANAIAGRLMGDLVFSNMLLFGFAWQKGLAPLSLAAIERAIELNGVAVDKNKRAFALGRAAAIDAQLVHRAAGLVEEKPAAPDLQAIVNKRFQFLTDYQNTDYAESYRRFIEKISMKTDSVPGSEGFVLAVARYLFKLMAYKDEYEVARLYTDGSFRKKLTAQFSGDYKLKFHMAPPVFNSGLDDQGRPKKSQFGPWMMAALGVMAKFKFLRGTAFDPFGRSDERRMERQLIADYRSRMSKIADALAPETMETAIAIASLPDDIRGYGPVKEASVEKTKLRLEELTQALENPLPMAEVA